MAYDFRGKVALVTGSSSGIGAAIAAYFAKLSCSVMLTGRNEKGLAESAQECIRQGGDEKKVKLPYLPFSFVHVTDYCLHWRHYLSRCAA